MYEVKNLNYSLVAAADIDTELLLTVDSNGAAALAGDASIVIGASTNNAVSGHAIPIANGIVRVTAGGVVPAGSKVMATAGKALVATTGKTIAGIALTAAGGAGETISVLLPVATAVVA